MAMELTLHTGFGARDLPRVKVTYLDECTITNWRFASHSGDELTVALFDHSKAALREREELTYSWGGPP
jgi:hypothetical protein